jgi:predicted nucleic acid-binding protein
MYCLDTNAIIYILQNKHKVADTLLTKDINSVYTTIINYTELLYGAYNSTKVSSNLEQINGFVSNIKLLEFNKESAKLFAIEKARLRKLGKIIDNMDILIASICITGNATLVTDNTKHFSEFKDLKIENWVER